MISGTCTCDIDGGACGLPLTSGSYDGLLGLRIFQCQLGHIAYERSGGAIATLVHFRRSKDDELWHFSRACPDWPLANYLENTAITGIVCSRCIGEFVVIVSRTNLPLAPSGIAAQANNPNASRT